MEITPKRYWRRWRRRGGYEKIDPKRVKETDPMTRKKKRVWKRIKISKKLRIFKTTTFSAKKLLVWIRDSYVKMMMKLANSRVIVGSSGGGYGSGFGSGPVKEYDEKMLVEIYKSILMAKDIKPVSSEPPVISVTPVR